MAKLTIALEDELLRRARIRALEQGTSVNVLVRDYLTAFADQNRDQRTTCRRGPLQIHRHFRRVDQLHNGVPRIGKVL